MLSALRKERLLREKKLYDISKRSGISAGRLSLIERGYAMPRWEEMRAIAHALDVPVKLIFPPDEVSNA
jgi:transcriptional regulator with XRE-family HTH domain